ncbi:MAG TPA: hypothetical protein VFD74_02900 [Thermoleophilia bacterium]|nr:hypothetical protein [Thermoleophilia bacterium]
MSAHHRELAAGRWQEFSLVEQLANVGSEVERALSWTAKRNAAFSAKAFDRALELLDLTIRDPTHRHRLKELTRLREVLLDYFLGENEFSSTPSSWHRYFHPFGVAAALRRHAADH